jgi:protein subunit release factor A
VSLRIHGKGAEKLMETEPGGHRWQGPSGKKGSIHTSTVTVSVMPEQVDSYDGYVISDCRIDFYRAKGAGGQHRNKTDSACRVTHLPSGVVVRSEGSRSQHRNREVALEDLDTKLRERAAQESSGARKATSKGQQGSGMRGDKIRTTRLQDDQVTDHRSGKMGRAKKYLKGDLSWLS